ncbi:WD repeat-containing protein 81 [Schistocerca cancellata]|uniref:WD repeat-containing protein 81 n=1 Tax=Schistocerca cancellata TaxID=274614 RepID=UPI002117ED0B|nr:WD repeat-containing protein 81 [Schistocerca cancellata]
METAFFVANTFSVPDSYIKTTTVSDRVLVAVHHSWLHSLIRTHQLPEFIVHDVLLPEEVKILLEQGEDLGPHWKKIYVRILHKQTQKVIPLPRVRVESSSSETALSFSQLLHYVAQTNFKNLWKDAFKKYFNVCGAVSNDGKNASRITLTDSDAVMREVILRTFGCPIFRLDEGFIDVYNEDGKKSFEVHCNILPALCAVETPQCFLLIQEPYIKHTLQDCVTFSPALLGTSHIKPLFIIYQLLQAMRSMHDRGLVLGEIALSDILITENLWIQVMPRLEDNINCDPSSNVGDAENENMFSPKIQNVELVANDLKEDISAQSNIRPHEEVRAHQEYFQRYSNPHNKFIPKTDTDHKMLDHKSNKQKLEKIPLESYCEQWIRGQLSNFDYLTILNNLAGRRHGDPVCHHVMPWVTDFTSRTGSNWRDLTRSKYRLNKGDRQLDLTYDTATGTAQVPHHVSEVLSEITYYVYMARRIPKSILCKYVRPKWVPAEYPSSIQRMQEWTPDECIPEFFSDPTVFESIHEDLPNLEIPSWATSVEDFIERHRDILESNHVSERLHHWIDLTFGYKLSGSAAVKSKNVCLHLVDSHMTLAQTGVVQLFTQPHPSRICASPYWGKTPPRLQPSQRDKRNKNVDRASEDEGHSSGFEEDEQSLSQGGSKSSPLALNKLLSRSRGSLLGSFPTSSPDETCPQQKTGAGNGAASIMLPKDYNPVAAIQSVESMYNFLNKTLHNSPKSLKEESPCIGSGIGYKQIVASRRLHEMEVLGCIVVEMLLAQQLRPTSSSEPVCPMFRLEICRAALSRAADMLPRNVRHAISLLLMEDTMRDSCGRRPAVTSRGLPPPSAHQLLQPLLAHCAFPFPAHFLTLTKLLCRHHDFCSLVREMSFLNLQETVEPDIAEKIMNFITEINKLKVKVMKQELTVLLPEISSVSQESLELILPYIKELMEDPETSVLAAWNLFDLVAKHLGPKHTSKFLMPSILKLYENGTEDDSEQSSKHVKLYHHIFLLQLIVRLGLKTFLENFVSPLVEAVGGYRDYYSRDGASFQQGSDLRNATSSLKGCDFDDSTVVGVLSPLDEDSSGDSEKSKPSSGDNVEQTGETEKDVQNGAEPEVFVFETGEKSSPDDPETPLYHLMEHLDLELPDPAAIDDDGSLEINFQEDETVHEAAEEDAIEVSEDFSDPEFHAADGSTVHFNTPAAFLESKDIDVSEMEPAAEETPNKTNEIQPLRKKSNAQFKVSDMSAESVIWLSHRLGPVLTARHLSRNLLRMLALCYTGYSNMARAAPPTAEMGTLSIAEGHVQGDHSACKVLDCLTSIAALYGEQMIVLQYLPHMSELIALCKRKLTPNLEGGVVGSLALLRHIVPFLSDAVLMDQLQDVILKSVLNPVVRLLSTTRTVFPSGAAARSAVARKFADAIYVVALRIGQEMSRRHLAVPLLQRFFLAFDKAFMRCALDDSLQGAQSVNSSTKEAATRSDNDSEGPDISIGAEMRGNLLNRVKENDFTDSYSPPPAISSDGEQLLEQTRHQAMEELKKVFVPELAHRTYLPLLRFLGESVMAQSLKNEEFIRSLCSQAEQESQQQASPVGIVEDTRCSSDRLSPSGTQVAERTSTGSFGSNVEVVGNRIDLQSADIPSVLPTESAGIAFQESAGDLMNLISKKMENTNRHLHGNWLAYWEHEIGRPDKETNFNFKQIKLQRFSGHTSNIRTIQVLDNENSFLSGSRDKTVKLWSLRSQGDGTAVSPCRWTYTGHRKCVLAVALIESLRLAASCDSIIHIWDPFMGSVIAHMNSPRYPPVNVLQALPPPSRVLLAATTDTTLRLVDARTCSFVNELKVSQSATGLIRCIAVGPEGTWVAVGQSSGFLSMLDIRTGGLLASWKGHDSEILQLISANGGNSIVSSSLDQAVSVWSAVDGRFCFPMKGPTEPVHCLMSYGSELISGTTASRIGVHSAVDMDASYTSTRLRSDTFKGVLTSMAVLPLNRLLLLGADSGNITLLC